MSTVRQLPNRESIKDEAAEWVVKLYGETYKTDREISEDNLAELEAWMDQSSLHRETFFKTLGSWDAISMLGELAEIMPLSELQRRNTLGLYLQRWSRSFVAAMRSRLGVTFSGALAAGVAVFFWVAVDTTPQPGDFMTAIGEQAKYTLSDGSILTLNTDSRVSIDFSGDRRVVNLDKGEANFEVSKDSDWPFVVYAGDGMVWAVGTAFNVSYQDDYVDVIVSEGTVKVFSGASLGDGEPALRLGEVIENLSQNDQFSHLQEVVLEAGEAAKYSRQQVSKEPIEVQRFIQELAWHDGSLVFRGETLEQALAEISRYTDKQLVIVDPSIRTASVGGRYKVGDIDALIDSLALGLDIQTSYSEEGSILFSAH